MPECSPQQASAANRGIGQALVEKALRKGARRVYAGTRQPLTHARLGEVQPLRRAPEMELLGEGDEDPDLTQLDVPPGLDGAFEQQLQMIDMRDPKPIARAAGDRWLTLIVLCVATLMIILDTTIVNVALPSIQRDLRLSGSNLAWIVNAYLIPFGGLLLLAGRLGDLAGRKRVFVSGLAVFTAASFLCGLSGGQAMLISARAIQGIGGALSSAVVLAMIVTCFPEARERARAIGVLSFTAAAGGSIGLLAGGVLTQTVSWHWIFFVNVPIGAAVLVLAAHMIEPDSGLGHGPGADVAGAALVTAALTLGVYTIVGTADHGSTPAHTIGAGVAAAGLLAAFLVRQSRATNPLLPLAILRSRTIAGSSVVQLLMVGGLLGMFFTGALYLQHVLGYDPLRIGLGFLPSAAAVGTFSFHYSARLTGRFGARAVLLAGLALAGAGDALLARAPVEARYVVDVLPAMVLTGVGAGLAFPAVMTLGMSRATAGGAGLISGLFNTTQQVGGAVGLAVLAAVAARRSDQLLTAGWSAAPALTDGLHLALATGAGLEVAALLVAATVLRPPKTSTAARPEEAARPVESR